MSKRIKAVASANGEAHSPEMEGLLAALATALDRLRCQAAAKAYMIGLIAARSVKGHRLTPKDLRNIQEAVYDVERIMLRVEEHIAAVERKAVAMGMEPMPEPTPAPSRAEVVRRAAERRGGE